MTGTLRPEMRMLKASGSIFKEEVCNMDKLEKADLFTDYDINIIMTEIERDIAGNVSESWMEQFVAALK